MTTDQPILVYRGRSLSEAKDLALFLQENGVDARLIEGDPLGHAHPAADLFHDVMAVNCDHAKLRSLTSEWESRDVVEVTANNESFCYHCGQELDEPAAVCPHCNQSLVD